MANKSDLLKYAQRLASQLGNKLDLSKLPKGRMPTPRDTKPEIEAAIAVLEPPPVADPAPAPEPDVEGEERKLEKISRTAWACWASLKEKAPDKLPEEFRTMSRGYFRHMLNRLMAEGPDELEKLARDLKALADAHVPLPSKQDISTIQRNINALKDSVTFPDELKEAGAEILAIADLSQRYDRLRIMPADTVRQLAEAFDDARMRKLLEQASSAADDVGTRHRPRKKERLAAAAQDPARPTFPSDPEDSNSDSARPSNGTAGATEGENDVNEEQLRRIVSEVLAAKVDPLAQKLNQLEQKVQAGPQVPADKLNKLAALADVNLVNKETLNAKLEAQKLSIENRVAEGFNTLIQDHLPALVQQMREAVAPPAGVPAAGTTPVQNAGQAQGQVVVTQDAPQVWWRRQQNWLLAAAVVILLVIVVSVMQRGDEPVEQKPLFSGPSLQERLNSLTEEEATVETSDQP